MVGNVKEDKGAVFQLRDQISLSRKATTIENFDDVPGVAHDVGVGVGAIGEGERPTIGVGGNLAVGEAGGEEEGPRATHSQLDDVRHDPVERHLK